MNHFITKFICRCLFAGVLFIGVSCKRNHRDFLTPEEQTWLEQNQDTIEVLLGYVAPPNVFYDENGNYVGLMMDFQHEIEEILNCRFVPRKFAEWNGLIEHAKTGRGFVIVGAASTETRAHFLLFSDPLIKIPYVAVTRNSSPFRGMKELPGHTVCSVEGYAVNEYLTRYYPDMQITSTPDDLQGLRAVAGGHADAVIANQMYASYLIENKGFVNLKFAFESGYENRLCAAVSRTDHVLSQIINKAVDRISPARRKELYSKWGSPHVFGLPRSTWMILGMSTVTILTLLIALWLWVISLRRIVQKQTRELHEKKKHLEAVITHAPVPMVMIDHVQNTAIGNRQFTLQFGHRPSEFKTEDELWRTLCPQEDERQKIIDWLTRRSSLPATNHPQDAPPQWMLTSRNGQIRETSVDITLLDNTSVITLHDMTEQHRAEQERLKLGKLESLGVLAGGIAHDFNNLLTSIFGNIELAEMALSPEHKSSRFLSAAMQSMQQAVALTKQLLTFSKGGDPVKETLDLATLIHESAHFFLHGSKIKLDMALAADLQPVHADRGQLSQVIGNLLLNAQQAMADRGTLSICAENTTTPPDFVKLCIRDNGPGISPEVLDKIFDPYFTTKKEGSGLGLASAHSIINRHGGTITAESTWGKGTGFTILLPAGKPSQICSKPADTPQQKTLSAHILVMDDETPIRNLVKTTLSETGAHIDCAADGQRAVSMYHEAFDRNSAYDAVILDLTIPGGTGGKQAAEEILAIDSNARLIASSGYSTDPVMADFAEYGFKAVIEKPYRLTKLVAVVQRVLNET